MPRSRVATHNLMGNYLNGNANKIKSSFAVFVSTVNLNSDHHGLCKSTWPQSWTGIQTVQKNHNCTSEDFHFWLWWNNKEQICPPAWNNYETEQNTWNNGFQDIGYHTTKDSGPQQDKKQMRWALWLSQLTAWMAFLGCSMAKPSHKQYLGPDGFTSEFYQHLRMN